MKEAFRVEADLIGVHEEEFVLEELLDLCIRLTVRAFASSEQDLQLTCLERVEVAIDLHLFWVEAEELLPVLADVPLTGLMGGEELGFGIISSKRAERELLKCAIVGGNLF